jgi:hypothetical protein
MRPAIPFLCVACLTMTSTGCQTSARGNPEEEVTYPEPAYLPGGIADASGKTGFLSNPKGGIDAVDFESGKQLWHSDSASHPLLIHKDELIAQQRHDVNPIRIVAMSLAEKGEQLRVSDAIELFDPPEPKDRDSKLQATRMVAPDPKVHPTFCKGSIRQGQIYLEWYATGSDAALVHPLTGKVTSLPRQFEPGPGRKLAYQDIAKVAADPDALGPRNKIPKALVKKPDDPEPRGLFHIEADPASKDSLHVRRRWLVADTLAVLVERHSGDGRHTDQVLICWDVKTGKNLHTVRVARWSSHRDAGLNGTAFVGVADHGRYLITRSVEEPGVMNEDARRKWKPKNPKEYFVYSVKKGTQLHRLTPGKDDSAPFPIGPRVFYAAGGTLKAVDMATQELLWERPIGGNSRMDWRDR